MAMLDFIKLAKSHTGRNMAEALVDSSTAMELHIR